MSSVGGIDLGDNMIMLGLDSDRVKITVDRSDSGIGQILIAPIEGGERLSLKGYITFATEELLLALSAAGESVPLIHPRLSCNVLIEGVTMEDWIEYNDPLPADYRVGIIRLIGVKK